jgi:glycosyltransferase involved in cell wall biosynthesis
MGSLAAYTGPGLWEAFCLPTGTNIAKILAGQLSNPRGWGGALRLVGAALAAEPMFTKRRCGILHSRFGQTAPRSVPALCLAKPYAFYVGGWEERKNVPFLMYAFAAADLHGIELVLAGGEDEQRGRLLALAAALGIANRVHFLGWVDDAELPALYTEALCFVYPSAYEGFGLQLCEAMAVGSPVFAARATCLPEVLGDGGETFPLDDPSILARLLHRVSQDAAYRSVLVNRAKARAKSFSWRKTAEETLAVYRRTIDATRAVAGKEEVTRCSP